jgi:hypothetical protein
MKRRKPGSRKCETAQYVEKPVKMIERRIFRTRDGVRGSSSSSLSSPVNFGTDIRGWEDGEINEARWGAPEMGPGWSRLL